MRFLVVHFLDFEKWWGSPMLLTAGEMQSIADDLFVGNKLASGELRTSTGVRVDLRNIRSPMIVFCSWDDDITPLQQALGWILDLYDHEDEIVRASVISASLSPARWRQTNTADSPRFTTHRQTTPGRRGAGQETHTRKGRGPSRSRAMIMPRKAKIGNQAAATQPTAPLAMD